jgi:putative ABC transport system permease protein
MNLLQDFRYSARTLSKHPAFVITITLILALGIGANSTIFSVVNAVLIRPLPYEASDRIVMIWETNQTQGIPRSIVSPANFLDWKEQNNVFDHLAALRFWYYTVTGLGDPERYQGARVSADFFPLLNVTPELGRNFGPEEEQVGRDHVVILTHAFWQRHFGGDRNIIGRFLTIDGEPFTIIGVLPASFRFSRVLNAELEFWMPISFTPQQLTREDRSITVYGRLKQGVSLAQAQAEMDGIARRLEEQYPKTNSGWTAQVNNLQEQSTRPFRSTLVILMVVVGFVLLIACANVVNLLLTRATTRQKDFAVRFALGSSRSRLMRQLLMENLLLALLGGAAGLLLAYWGMHFLNVILRERVPYLEEIIIDRRVLGFTLVISLLVGVIVGSFPGLRASRLNLRDALAESGRTLSEAASRRRVRNLFVVLEITLAVPLLIGAGLMLRSSLLLQNIDRGIDLKNVLTVQIALPKTKYVTPQQMAAFYQQTLNRIQSEPEVQSASAVNFLPLTNFGDATRLTIEGRTSSVLGQETLASYRVIDPNYFRTMSIPLLRGRYFTEQDNDESRGVVMINQTMARRYWPNEDPIGKLIKPQFPTANVPWRPATTNTWLAIVGVVEDVKEMGVNAEQQAEIYLPYLQNPSSLMNLLVRSKSDPLRLVPAVRRQVLAVDGDQPVYNIKTMENVLSQSIATPQLITSLLTIFAAIALLLAAMGVYGVMSYSVAQRTHEVGVRMALGAQQQHVLRMILGHGLRLVLFGVGLGVMVALAVTRVISNLLFGVSATDPQVFVGVPLLLIAVALLATYFPARRALKVDPIIALREA